MPTCNPSSRRLRQEDPELEANLGYTARCWPKTRSNSRAGKNKWWSACLACVLLHLFLSLFTTLSLRDNLPNTVHIAHSPCLSSRGTGALRITVTSHVLQAAAITQQIHNTL